MNSNFLMQLRIYFFGFIFHLKIYFQVSLDNWLVQQLEKNLIFVQVILIKRRKFVSRKYFF